MYNDIYLLGSKTPVYLTTPIFYVNGAPHIGHLYTMIIGDVLNRFFSRFYNRKTFFLTGTDEHGQKIYDSAILANRSLEDHVLIGRESFITMAKNYTIEYDYFIHTNKDFHIKAVQTVWQELQHRGFIYRGVYRGLYSKVEETFYKTKDLINGLTPFGNQVEEIEQECFFFKLSSFEKKLLEFYEQNPDFVLPAAKINELVSFVTRGLEDICVSRKTKINGIPIPGEEDREESIYVWFDALINYISGLGFGTDSWEINKTYWENSYHILGKDILYFHGIIWPAICFSLGLTPPKQLIVHGWWTVEGEKMSKSRNNVIDPEAIRSKYSVDAIKYFFLREMSVGNDGNFSESNLKNRINGELVNNIGNLVHRFNTLLITYNGGFIPEGQLEIKDLLNIENLTINMESYINQLDFNGYFNKILEISTKANCLIDHYKPWKESRTSSELNNLYYSVAVAIHFIGSFLYICCPEISNNILKSLGVNGNISCYHNIVGRIVSKIESPIVKKII